MNGRAWHGPRVGLGCTIAIGCLLMTATLLLAELLTRLPTLPLTDAAIATLIKFFASRCADYPLEASLTRLSACPLQNYMLASWLSPVL
jgi:hypothetical protein